MGHKTSGDWSDVTSLGRNDIVFEGRNKTYGAYYIRQRYDRALLLGLLFSLSFIVVGVGVPILIHKLTGNAVIVPPVPFTHEHTITKWVDVIPKVIKKDNFIKPRPIQPQTQHTIPVIVQHTDKPDSVHTQRDLLHEEVGATTITGTQAHVDPTPQPNPNPGPSNTGTMAPFHIVEHMPQFPGDMGAFIRDHVEFPAMYREMGIQGTVYATFVVEPDGTISGIQILRGINGAEKLNDATLKGLQQMPNWIPGSQNGHNVRVQYTLPVKFELSNY